MKSKNSFSQVLILLVVGAVSSLVVMPACQHNKVSQDNMGKNSESQLEYVSGREGHVLSKEQIAVYRSKAFLGDHDAIDRLERHYAITDDRCEVMRWASVAVVLKMKGDWMDVVLRAERLRPCSTPSLPESPSNESEPK